MALASALARHIVRTEFSDLPPETVEVTKRSILDTMGVILAASTLEDGCRGVVSLVKEMGGKAESSILAFGGKVSCGMAAFANGSMTHALDYDDTADDAVVHPTGASFPAALAVAERLGKVSGRDFITAIALGNDLSTRLALALKGSVVTTGWVNPSVFGIFGGVAAAGKLLGLTEEQMAHAFCFGFYQAGGSIEVAFGTGSTIRAIRDAFTGKTAVLSALLASQGLTGVETSLDGPFGLYNLYFKGSYDAESITQGLGKVFYGTWVSFKPWPCCRGTHSCVDATLALVKERNLLPGDVEGVTVTVGEHGRALCTPLEERRRPKLSIDAKHSIPFTVALAIARRNIVLADFKAESLSDPEILRLAQKVDWKFNPEFATKGIEPGMVEVRLKGGVAYSRKVDFAYGNPKNPISPDDLVTKFRDCAAYAISPIAREVLEKVIQGVSNLESAADMGQIVEPLAREGALQR